LSINGILERAQAREAKEILHQYTRHDPAAVDLVEELIASANVSIDGFMGDALAERLEDIDRIDRLATTAENRRNISLREIERRRALFGESRPSQEIESDKYEVIELRPAKGDD